MRLDRLHRAVASFAIALFFVLSSFPVLAQPTSLEKDRFAELLNVAGEAPEGREAAAYRRVWNGLDSLALARLNAGTAPGELDGVLSALPGYAGPSEGEGVATENTIFYGSLPRDAPNYLAAPLRVGRDTVVLGLYSLMHNTPGRMSVYARREGRWRRTGGYDAPLPISARLLFPGDSSVAVVAFEDRRPGGLPRRASPAGGGRRARGRRPGARRGMGGLRRRPARRLPPRRGRAVARGIRRRGSAAETVELR
jgi:hypothetical protein